MNNRLIYWVYDAKTDELLCIGTAEECERALNRKNFRCIASRVRRGITKKYAIFQSPALDVDYSSEIRRWMAADGLRTICSLARDVGVDADTAVAWLSGRRYPNKKNAKKLNQILFGG